MALTERKSIFIGSAIGLGLIATGYFGYQYLQQSITDMQPHSRKFRSAQMTDLLIEVSPESSLQPGLVAGSPQLVQTGFCTANHAGDNVYPAQNAGIPLDQLEHTPSGWACRLELIGGTWRAAWVNTSTGQVVESYMPINHP